MKPDNVFERALLWLFGHRSDWSIISICLGLWLGLGLALPLALSLPLYWFVTLNLIGVSFAFLAFMVWLAVGIEEGSRRNLLDWTSDVFRLNPHQFELLVAELFRREGWQVTERGGLDGPDGGIDIELNRSGERRLVQVKRWSSPIGVDQVRSFLGVLLREGLSGSNGSFVTQSTFFAQAVAEANRAGLTLIDRTELSSRIDSVRRPEPCPICSAPMRLDHSPFGYWFHCVANGCKGKRDLGDDSYAALRLLTTERRV
jgi:hypothetical protein